MKNRPVFEFYVLIGAGRLSTRRLARAVNAPLKRLEVSIERVIETEALRGGPDVSESVQLESLMAGVVQAQAQQFIDT